MYEDLNFMNFVQVLRRIKSKCVIKLGWELRYSYVNVI